MTTLNTAAALDPSNCFTDIDPNEVLPKAVPSPDQPEDILSGPVTSSIEETTTTMVLGRDRMNKLTTLPPQSKRAPGTVTEPPHPSYFHPVNHRVLYDYQPNDFFGHIFTQGMHQQGFPELFAAGVPRNRADKVIKNMRFLTSLMIKGTLVLPGHRSTDEDYRVKISEIVDDGHRQSVLFHFIGGANLPIRVLQLQSYYVDAEEWGSFPPAPEGQRARRNRLLNVALYPGNSGDGMGQSDAVYFLRHIHHFCHILGGDPQTIIAHLPVGVLKHMVCQLVSWPSSHPPLPTKHVTDAAATVEDHERKPTPPRAKSNNTASKRTASKLVERPPASENASKKQRVVVVKKKKTHGLPLKASTGNRSKTSTKKKSLGTTDKENAVNHTSSIRHLGQHLLKPAPLSNSAAGGGGGSVLSDAVVKSESITCSGANSKSQLHPHHAFKREEESPTSEVVQGLKEDITQMGFPVNAQQQAVGQPGEVETPTTSNKTTMGVQV